MDRLRVKWPGGVISLLRILLIWGGIPVRGRFGGSLSPKAPSLGWVVLGQVSDPKAYRSALRVC